MFGDKPLVGKYTYNIDSKNRIFIPSNTGREQGDIVYFRYDKDIECYALCPERVIKETLAKLQKKVDEAKTSSEAKEYKLMLLDYSESVLKISHVDSQGRFILSGDFNEFKSMDMVGAGDYLVLTPTNKKIKK